MLFRSETLAVTEPPAEVDEGVIVKKFPEPEHACVAGTVVVVVVAAGDRRHALLLQPYGQE